jgi:hypothetical protein
MSSRSTSIVFGKCPLNRLPCALDPRLGFGAPRNLSLLLGKKSISLRCRLPGLFLLAGNGGTALWIRMAGRRVECRQVQQVEMAIFFEKTHAPAALFQ